MLTTSSIRPYDCHDKSRSGADTLFNELFSVCYAYMLHLKFKADLLRLLETQSSIALPV